MSTCSYPDFRVEYVKTLICLSSVCNWSPRVGLSHLLTGYEPPCISLIPPSLYDLFFCLFSNSCCKHTKKEHTQRHNAAWPWKVLESSTRYIPFLHLYLSHSSKQYFYYYYYVKLVLLISKLSFSSFISVD